jgi:tRNA nucleotidyltransferase (CCA-adding enzyme)
MQKILNKVLEEIKPSKKDEKEVLSKANSIINKINKNIKDAKAILGGSGAKGTWLKNAYDVDIFVKFNYNKYKNKSSELSNILEKVLKRIFKQVIRLHGSRDYFQLKKDKFTFEIVPILDIKKAEQALNITDISPLHAEWVKKHSRYVDDIRLVKQFCKVAKVYGAESYIMGFSGYICEILTIYYRGFVNLLKNAVKWHYKSIIDIEHYYRNKSEVFFNINKSKLQSPLIIIDPVQRTRNAAAALSKEKFLLFKKKAKSFLKKPSIEFFQEKEFSLEDLKDRYKNKKIILLNILTLKEKEDVAGSKLLKAYNYIHKELRINEFTIKDSGWEWDKKSKALFWFVFDKGQLSKFIKRTGPPLKNKYHVKNFKKKYRSTFVEKNKVCANIKRKYRKPENLIKDVVKDGYVKDKVRRIELVKK